MRMENDAFVVCTTNQTIEVQIKEGTLAPYQAFQLSGALKEAAADLMQKSAVRERIPKGS